MKISAKMRQSLGRARALVGAQDTERAFCCGGVVARCARRAGPRGAVRAARKLRNIVAARSRRHHHAQADECIREARAPRRERRLCASSRSTHDAFRASPFSPFDDASVRVGPSPSWCLRMVNASPKCP